VPDCNPRITKPRRFVIKESTLSAVRLWLSAFLVVIVGLFVLDGCGHSSARRLPSSPTLTVPAYGPHAQTTESATRGSPAFCRNDARVVARDATLFLAHSGAAAAYPADLYYVIIRQDFTDLEAHSCPTVLLGDALHALLTATQQRRLISDLPSAMAAAFGRALASP
jgi:hypothetical protein